MTNPYSAGAPGARVVLYVRVSTLDQDPASQLHDLRRYAEHRGWTIADEFIDHGISGTKDSRPALNRLMAAARQRRLDVVLVWRFDRFARSTSHLIRALDEFRSLGVAFCSFSEALDTSTPTGKVMFTVIAAMAEFERALIQERVRAGLRRARAAGVQLGRPRVGTDLPKAERLLKGGLSLRGAAKQLGLSDRTLRRRLANTSTNAPAPAPA
jgi:DNA invertase Pin-like site-specific DNA recombinase